ncbi:hypothetical protein BJY00DRAFT_60974 [Aspergillus carlsbadensis]|nr:hypothetical protein BJY00DRAFT_60974 [Aspergillus carlsbadensis]
MGRAAFQTSGENPTKNERTGALLRQRPPSSLNHLWPVPTLGCRPQPILSVSPPSSGPAFFMSAWRGTVRFLPGLSQWVIRAVASIHHIVQRPPPVDFALLTSGWKGFFDQDSPVIKRIRLILRADLIGLPIAPPTPQTPVSHLALQDPLSQR